VADSLCARSRTCRGRRTGIRRVSLVIPVTATATFVWCTLIGGPAASGAPSGLLPAASASSFSDGVGVNIHLGYSNTSYADTDRVLSAVTDLGVRHVRDSLPPKPDQRLLAGLRDLPSRGLSADLALAQIPLSATSLPDPAVVFEGLQRADVRPSLDAVEVPNEWDHHHTPNWPGEIATWTRGFSAKLRSDPAWNGTIFVGPSTSGITHVTAVPNLGTAIDASNLHIYTAGGPPEKELSYLDKARQMAPGKPLYVTEMGFHTAVNQNGKQPAVTEPQQGNYLLRQLLENYRAGASRSYVYELLEERADPALSNQERHFGLLRSDFSQKPAYTMLRTLMHELQDPGPAAGSPVSPVSPLPAQLSTTGRVQSLLFGKSDGSYRLVLWTQGGLALDGRTKSKDATVHLQISGAPRQVTVVRTASGAVQGATAVRASEVTGRLGGDPVVIEIGSDHATAPPAATRRVVDFDATGAAPAADTAPNGRVGQPDRRVLFGLISATGLLLAVALTTIVIWTTRRRKRGAR
jgi:hypothetical protein